MTITYRIGFQDRLAFAAYHLPRKPLIILMTVGLFLLINFQSLIPAVRQISAGKPLAASVVAFIFLELLLIAFIVAFWAIVTLLTMISPKNKPLYCERSLSIHDDMFISESQYGRSEVRWSLVQKLARTRSHIFLYLNQENAVAIPRRAFANTEQWNKFYEICKENKRRVA